MKIIILVLTFVCFVSPNLMSREKPQSRLALIVKTLAEVDNPAVQINILKGVLAGLKGVNTLSAPENWSTVSNKLLSSSNSVVRSLVTQLSQKFGDRQAIETALKNLQSSLVGVNLRRQALLSLVSQNNKELLPILKGLLSGPLKLDAIRAYGTFNDDEISSILLKKYPTFDPSARRTVIETLSTRKLYALALMRALKKGIVKKDEVPAYVARNLQNMLGKRFTDVYGEVNKVSKDKAKLISQYKARLAAPDFAKASASHGRAVFERTCAACHKMFEDGGDIGPDITGSNRVDRDYILLNIIDPNFDVPEAYRLVTITKKDGQSLSGTILEEDKQKIVLKMVGVKMVISKGDIAKRQVSKVSMMPEGLLNTMTESDFLNLIKYLQTEKQVELPK